MKKFYKLFLILSLLFSYNISKAGIVSVNVKSKAVGCNGATDGYITIDSISSTAPSGPYIITITTTPVQTILIGDTVKNLGQGTYTIRVTDLGDPTQIFPFNENVTVGGPLPLISNIAANAATCFGECDGQAFVQALQGTSPYTFLWDDPTNSTLSIVPSLCARTYNVTVSDANGCTTTNSIAVTQPSQIVPNASATPIDCNGANNGTVSSAPSGGSGAGYTFLWNDPSNATTPGINGLMQNSYTVTVTDGAGCT
ncbi:MAG: SprB repeat-containing protein, partial [Flavobacteriales bacterium]|nr:SprB repeat-containing protein [Flavobacteriales bacterium]